MLLTGIIVLLLYSSYNNVRWEELKNIYRMSGIIVLYSIVILYNSTNIIYIGKSLSIFNDLIVITPYSVYIKILILIISIIYIIAINEYMKLNISPYSLNYSDYIILILFNILGMCIFIESYNTLLIYIAIELQSYSIYIITSRYNNSYNSSKSGLIYFLLGSLASIIILIGLVLLYSVTGLTNIYDISTYISVFTENIINTNNSIENIKEHKLILGYLFIFIGLLFKIGVAPFHNWLINIYVNVPTIVTLWISLVTKISILTFIYTLLYNTPYIYNISLNIDMINTNLLNIILILSILSVISMILGSIGGLSQLSIKRIIAYSGLTNTGYMLYAIISNNQLTLQSYIFYISQYSLTHINWFLILLITIIYKAIIPIINDNNKNLKLNNQSYNKLNTELNNNNILKLERDNNNRLKLEIDNNNRIYKGINIYLPSNIFEFGYVVNNRYLAFSYIVTLSSLIGIPPLLGFYGKYYIIISGMYSGYLYSTIILVLTSGITTYYYSYIINKLLPVLYNKHNNIFSNILNISNVQSKSNIVVLSYLICYIISLITFIIIFPLISLDIYTNGSIILDFYQYTI